MPNIKSAEKRLRGDSKKTLQNQKIKSEIKTAIKKFYSFIENSDKAGALGYHAEIVKILDQAASKGVYHKNTIARKKSALAKALNKLA